MSMGVFSAACLFNAAFWGLRSRYDRQGVWNDLKWILACLLWFYQNTLYSGFLSTSALTRISLLILIVGTTSYFYASGDGGTVSRYKSGETEHRAGSSMLKPLLFPCRTSHTRFFPKKHSFSYSYLFVGVPIGWKGYIGRFLSADLEGGSFSQGAVKPPERWPSTWFTIQAVDYLQRGGHALGLQGKLDEYLKSQDEDSADYAYAYLVTAPRFLGYSFNPVSFWYLYNSEKALSAMILEVNNTFDERRMYFLKGSKTMEVESFVEDADDKARSKGLKDFVPSPSSSTSAKFASKWAKDFHVSPFNSRKGSYSLSAYDPFFPHLSGDGAVNNTVTLSSSKNHAKLVAKIFSTQTSLDPISLNGWQMSRFVASWWWVGFVTYPRIVREAAKLFFKRKLHVWYRPEVFKESIGRHETGDERVIERCFRDYLRTRVENSTLALPFKYTSANSPALNYPQQEVFYPKSLRNKNSTSTTPEYITLKITTPLFYALFACAFDSAAFLSSSLETYSFTSQTFYTSHLSIVISLFIPPENWPLLSPSPSSSSAKVHLTWVLIHYLRFFLHPSLTHASIPSPSNPVDQHAQSNPSSKEYRVAVLSLLLSDLLGVLPALLDFSRFLVRANLRYVCAAAIFQALRIGSEQTGFRGEDWKLGFAGLGIHLWWVIGKAI